MLPAPAFCTEDGAAKALEFLTTKWLCDVATDFKGRCVLIALALSIVERVLLPERPAFFVTAGKRGGGKTTALAMCILAVTGRKPAAAAWSSNEEERRKAILTYLAEGMAAVVWDNIPMGTTIACPTIEKVLTAESYSDRILGQSSNMTVPAYTVMCFTGNNIAPRGDLASRSLITRLEVDRPDPENRKFIHADPMAWTLENRGAILSALYTLLSANPQLQLSKAAPLKTRFKTWWHLVGSAIENGAAALVAREQTKDKPADQRATPIDFGQIFAAIEAEDEDGTLLADVLDALRWRWDDQTFTASEVAGFINNPLPDEAEAAATLRGFFDPGGKRSPSSITPIMVGRRFGSVAGAPVLVGDEVMRLDRSTPAGPGSRKAVALFRVRVL